MKNQKVVARIVAGLLAVLVLSGVFMQLFSVMASAAEDITETFTSYDSLIVTQNDKLVERILVKHKYELDLYFSWKDSGTGVPNRTVTNVTFGANSRYWSKDGATMTIKFSPDGEDGEDNRNWIVHVNIKGLQYNNSKNEPYLVLTNIRHAQNKLPADFPTKIGITISESDVKFGPDKSSGSDDDYDETITPDIVIESVFARDKNGAIIREVTKDTAPFSLDIVYTDRGFGPEHIDEFTDDTLFAYITDAGEFIPQGSNRGTLKRIVSADGDPPRFRVTFENLKYGGSSANYAKLDFRVQYLVYGENISGTGSARLYSIKPEGNDSDDETAPPTPYIIISQYDLGSEQIEAGSTFTLSMQFSNTSSTLPLENIMMVVNPVSTEQQQSYLSIASATNTYYYDSLPAGGTLSQSVDILVKASATVGSQAVSVDFKYEYLVDKKRESGTTNTIIYVPITQIDRFTVDPITDYSQYMQLGEEGYVTVSFVNRGKSTTYNVSGYLLDSEGNQGQTEHFGNLEAGANGSLDFTIIPQTVGEYQGTIVIQYEDENGEEKEIPRTFSAFVEEPWFPGPIDPGMDDPGMFEPQEPSTPWWKYLLFVVGGLAIAVPIALYLAKRVMAKGREDMDEDF